MLICRNRPGTQKTARARLETKRANRHRHQITPYHFDTFAGKLPLLKVTQIETKSQQTDQLRERIDDEHDWRHTASQTRRFAQPQAFKTNAFRPTAHVNDRWVGRDSPSKQTKLKPNHRSFFFSQGKILSTYFTRHSSVTEFILSLPKDSSG
jgi:hypothetical protein